MLAVLPAHVLLGRGRFYFLSSIFIHRPRCQGRKIGPFCRKGLMCGNPFSNLEFFTRSDAQWSLSARGTY